MDLLFTNVKGQFALVYLDDIVILLLTPEEHVPLVCEVLMQLHHAAVTFT